MRVEREVCGIDVWSGQSTTPSEGSSQPSAVSSGPYPTTNPDLVLTLRQVLSSSIWHTMASRRSFSWFSLASLSLRLRCGGGNKESRREGRVGLRRGYACSEGGIRRRKGLRECTCGQKAWGCSEG